MLMKNTIAKNEYEDRKRNSSAIEPDGIMVNAEKNQRIY